jgi:hypothetical protein
VRRSRSTTCRSHRRWRKERVGPAGLRAETPKAVVCAKPAWEPPRPTPILSTAIARPRPPSTRGCGRPTHGGGGRERSGGSILFLLTRRGWFLPTRCLPLARRGFRLTAPWQRSLPGAAREEVVWGVRPAGVLV